MFLDADAVTPVKYGGQDTRTAFKSGLLSFGDGPEEVQQFSRLLWVLALRSRLFNVELPQRLKPGAVLLDVRGTDSTVVYQGIRDGGVLAMDRDILLRALDRLHLDPYDMTAVLLPGDSEESYLERLGMRTGSDGRPEDLFDTAEKLEASVRAYGDIAAKPEDNRRISLATHSAPSAAFRESRAPVLETMITLRAIAAGIMAGARCDPDVPYIVFVQQGSTPQRGEAEVNMDPFFELLEQGVQRVKDEDIMNHYRFLRNATPWAQRDHDLYERLWRGEKSIRCGDFEFAITDYGSRRVFSWEEGRFAREAHG